MVLLFEGEKLAEAWRCRIFICHEELHQKHKLTFLQDRKSFVSSAPRKLPCTKFKLPSYHDSALSHCRTFEDSTCFVMSIRNGKSGAQWMLPCFDCAIALRDRLQHFQHHMFFRWPTCLWPCFRAPFETLEKTAWSHGSVPIASHSLFYWYQFNILSLVYPIVAVGSAYPYDSLLDQVGMTSWPSSSGTMVYCIQGV